MNLGADGNEGQDQNCLLGQQYVDQEMLKLNGWYGMLLNHVLVDVEKLYPINNVALGI